MFRDRVQESIYGVFNEEDHKILNVKEIYLRSLIMFDPIFGWRVNPIWLNGQTFSKKV